VPLREGDVKTSRSTLPPAPHSAAPPPASIYSAIKPSQPSTLHGAGPSIGAPRVANTMAGSLPALPVRKKIGGSGSSKPRPKAVADVEVGRGR
jgi:hypothetical protein